MPSLREKYEQLRNTPQGQGLLRMIRHGEGTAGPQGYQTMFGGGTFDTSKGWRHPDRVIRSGGYASAAAGAYQYLPGTWQSTAKALGLTSFDPVSQDLGALYLADKRGALDILNKGGKLADVMDKLAPEWASIPTRAGVSYYGQPVKTQQELVRAYEEGKKAAPTPTQPSPSTAEAVQKGNTMAQTILEQVLKRAIPAVLQPRSQLMSPQELVDYSSALLPAGNYLDMFR